MTCPSRALWTLSNDRCPRISRAESSTEHGSMKREPELLSKCLLWISQPQPCALVKFTYLRVSIIFARFSVQTMGPWLHKTCALCFDICRFPVSKRFHLLKKSEAEYTVVSPTGWSSRVLYSDLSFPLFCLKISRWRLFISCKMLELYSSCSKDWEQIIMCRD